MKKRNKQPPRALLGDGLSPIERTPLWWCRPMAPWAPRCRFTSPTRPSPRACSPRRPRQLRGCSTEVGRTVGPNSVDGSEERGGKRGQGGSFAIWRVVYTGDPVRVTSNLWVQFTSEWSITFDLIVVLLRSMGQLRFTSDCGSAQIG